MDEVTRTHHADVYEMETPETPDSSMAKRMRLRCSVGKLRARLAGDQSSRNKEARRRIGMVRRLL